MPLGLDDALVHVAEQPQIAYICLGRESVVYEFTQILFQFRNKTPWEYVTYGIHVPEAEEQCNLNS